MVLLNDGIIHDLEIPACIKGTGMRKTGFDLGQTLCESNTEYLRTGDQTLAARIPGAFEAVGASVEQNGADNNYIVSTCGVNVQGYSWDWLDEEDFFILTGFHRSR